MNSLRTHLLNRHRYRWRWRRRAAGALCLALLGAGDSAHAGSIANSKHNLSASGPGEVRAVTESEVCIFCHTAHTAAPQSPLWNRFDSGAIYTPYDSTTVQGRPGQPSGSSKLCLSCHDGTVALGMLRSRNSPVEFRGSGRIDAGRGQIGMDLGDDHPISFRFDGSLAARNGQLHNPTALSGRARLSEGMMECTSCHDAHDDAYGKFLVQDNTGSALCLECHDPDYWETSSHRTSLKRWSGTGPNPWPHTERQTVADNGCENCHVSHNAGNRERLMLHARDEDNCLSCHNGQVAETDIEAEFLRPFVHPIRETGDLHDPTENPVNASRHVTCADCHNPHAGQARAAVSGAPDGPAQPPGQPAKVRGVSAAGTVVDRISHDYELCYRCHADSLARGRANIPRQDVQTNTRLEFDPGNRSYHPIQTVGRNPNVPSLIAPLTTSSQMTCIDCHNSPAGPGAGGTGPSGPHGSHYPALMERRLEFTDFQEENSDTYALCYKCHSRTSILGNESFPQHREHIVDQKTSCMTCHDPHGVAGNSALINFNVLYVSPSSNGQLEFQERGRFAGSCSLTCHGTDHDNLSYGR